MLDRLTAKSEVTDLKASAPEPEPKKFTYEVLDASADRSSAVTKPRPSWNFSNIPLFPALDGSSCARNSENSENEPPAANIDGETDVSRNKDGERDVSAAHDRRTCNDQKCALCAAGGEQHEHGKDRARARGTSANDFAPVAKNKCSANNGKAACNCQKCSASDQSGTVARDNPPAPAHTYTFISRESYGETAANFTAPRCAPGGGGSAVLQAGYALPAVTVFPNGTYTVRRNDGVVQTATCRRLAAGLAATRTHENSHAAGARRAAAAGNTAANLPRNFAQAAQCTAALPGALATYNAARDPIWENEITHGPGTNPPTAATFTQENAAGTCTFA